MSAMLFVTGTSTYSLPVLRVTTDDERDGTDFRFTIDIIL